MIQQELFAIEAVLALVSDPVSPSELQSRLRDLGYYDGPVEEQPWPETRSALRRFQHDHGLRVTGYPDSETMTTLRETYCY
jgi:peptidoglycan hydrolase-like protein with peptidoglycan-binding domain